MAQVSRRRPVRHLAGEVWSRRSDRLAVEEPLEIRIGGEPFSVTMRTPGEDFELVLGYLFGEGIAASAGDVRALRYCLGTGPDGLNTYNVIDAGLAPGVPAPDPGLRRNVLTSSACGICGTTSIDTVLERTRPLPLPGHDPGHEPGHEPGQQPDRAGAAGTVPVQVLRRLPDRLREQQAAFERTGGLHAAGLFRVGAEAVGPAEAELLCVREDVGRHNAVDKVVGWALGAGVLPAGPDPAGALVLVVSGRASFELTQKAVQAGIGVLAAVSAPSTLAVELAERAGLTLAGFVRGETLNVYTHPERVTGPGADGARPAESTADKLESLQ